MYHPVVEKIKSALPQNHCRLETFEHEPVRTGEESARVRTGYSLDQKVKELLDTKSIRFATEEEVCSLTGGVESGGVPPFGNLFNLEVVADPRFFKREKIIFNAGDRRFSVAVKSGDYQ